MRKLPSRIRHVSTLFHAQTTQLQTLWVMALSIQWVQWTPAAVASEAEPASATTVFEGETTRTSMSVRAYCIGISFLKTLYQRLATSNPCCQPTCSRNMASRMALKALPLVLAQQHEILLGPGKAELLVYSAPGSWACMTCSACTVEALAITVSF